MGLYDIDKDVYKQWLEDKIVTIEKMTREEVETRVIEISKVEFLAKREWALLHQQWDKLSGRKGIAPWIKAERDGLITDPNIKVDWDGDPRKKDKKPRAKNDLGDLLGIDMGVLNQQVKSKEREKKNLPTDKPDKPMSMKDTIASLISVQVKKPVEKTSAEELKKKSDELKEKMRLAKEAKEKKV